MVREYGVDNGREFYSKEEVPRNWPNDYHANAHDWYEPKTIQFYEKTENEHFLARGLFINIFDNIDAQQLTKEREAAIAARLEKERAAATAELEKFLFEMERFDSFKKKLMS
jgi:hypothetical protein